MIKKNIIFITLFILLFPTIVLAKDTCNDNDIIIKSISLKSSNGFTEEVNESTISNNKINLDLKMYDIGDSIEYNILIKNNSSKDYYFTSDSFKIDTDYLEYSLLNNNETIKPGEEKTIQLKVAYKNKIPDNSFNDSNKVSISLSDTPLINPQTNSNYMFIFVLIVFICLSIYLKKKNINITNKKLFIIFNLISLIPITVYATCNIKIDIETKIEIDEREAIFLPGSEVNIKMKELTGDDTSTSTKGYNFQDENITTIKYSSVEPSATNKEAKNIVSTSDSPYQIYMWYDNGTIYWWSEDIHPNLNENSSYMFAYLKNLNDITGLEYFDTSSVINMTRFFSYCDTLNSLKKIKNWNMSNVENMYGMFAYAVSLTSLDGLENWNVSNVKNFSYLFRNDYDLVDISGLINWNVSNATTMKYMFLSCISLKEINLSNWDTSNVTDMTGIFYNNELLNDVSSIINWNVENVKSMGSLFCSCYSLEKIDLSHWKTTALTDMSNMFSMWENGVFTNKGNLKKIILSDNFDTSNVTAMHQTFANNTKIEDYSFLKYLNTSKVTDMTTFLQCNYNFKNNDLQYIKDYDVSQVTDFSYMFYNTKIINVGALKDWNTSNATNMNCMFSYCKLLESILGLENWNVSNVTNFSRMFENDKLISDPESINNWNIQSTATFTQMFRNVPTHPEFSKVIGTWDSEGTFTPTT